MRKIVWLLALAPLMGGCADFRHPFGKSDAQAVVTAAPAKQKASRKVRHYRARVPAQAAPVAPQIVGPALPPLVAPAPEPVRVDPPALPPTPVIEAPRVAPAKPKPGTARSAWDWFLRH